MSLPAWWTDERVLFFPGGGFGRPPLGTYLPDSSDWLHLLDGATGMNSIALTWRELERIEPVDPWPNLYIEWHWAGHSGQRKSPGVGERTIWPRFYDSRQKFADGVEALVTHVQEHAPRAVRRGWLDHPDTPWEPTPVMPDGPSGYEGAGPYRGAADRTGIIAFRVRPGPIETLWQLLASTVTHPFREFPRGIAVGREHVFVERRNRDVVRVPLSSLRLRRADEEDEHVIYVFGRHTRLVLPYRKGCPVRATLDGVLEGS